MLPHCVYIPLPPETQQLLDEARNDFGLEEKIMFFHCSLLSFKSPGGPGRHERMLAALERIPLTQSQARTQGLYSFGELTVTLVKNVNGSRVQRLHRDVLDAMRPFISVTKPFPETWLPGEDTYTLPTSFGETCPFRYIRNKFNPHITIGKGKKPGGTLPSLHFDFNQIALAYKYNGDWVPVTQQQP